VPAKCPTPPDANRQQYGQSRRFCVPTHSISCLPATACHSRSSSSAHRPFSLPLSVVAMMLVQKPQPVPSSPMMSFSHRRQISAPVVVVQPTHIPGLLSLSKPPRSFPRNQQRQSAKIAPKQALSTSAVGVRAPAQPLTPAAQIYTAPATPPQSRGRAQDSQSKDKNLRNKRFVTQLLFLILTHSDHLPQKPFSIAYACPGLRET